jgi:hypothetical protein
VLMGGSPSPMARWVIVLIFSANTMIYYMNNPISDLDLIWEQNEQRTSSDLLESCGAQLIFKLEAQTSS